MPRLLLDKEICLGNIERIARKAESNLCEFRPHVKTHQSAEIAGWLRDFGVAKITVSSFRMARYFAKAGWKDILVAFPFNPHDLAALNELSMNAEISILLDNTDTLAYLGRLDHPTPFYIDIDTGYGRTGIKSENNQDINALLAEAGKISKLQFSGFYCHAGHSYKSADPRDREAIHQKAIQDLVKLKKIFGHFNPLALYGDTPGCSARDDFGGIDELTPGNFVFYDLTQVMLGSCTPENVAVAMRCPVAGKYKDREQLLIHGGGVHFSKESLQINGKTIFGQVVSSDEEGWSIPVEAVYLTGLSQEHGLLEHAGELFKRTRIGDYLTILPVHSCMTANLMGEYRTIDGGLVKTMNS